MESQEIYIRSLLAQYRVNRLELIIFTIFFILALLAVGVAWAINHVYHDYRLGCVIGAIAVLLAAAMVTHCGNTLQTLKRVTGGLNKLMPTTPSFDYDQGKEDDKVRLIVTRAIKAFSIILAISCFFPWPQLPIVMK